jgi:hypothetical protein
MDQSNTGSLISTVSDIISTIACQAQCLMEATCLSWTYVTKTHPSGTALECKLYSDLTKEANLGAVWGKKTC